MKNKKQKESKELVKIKSKKNRFLETIKKKWLIDGTKTVILIIFILSIFFGINILLQKANIPPIDLSQEKLYTLTDESKEKVKNIEKDINIYLVEYKKEDSLIDLVKQYKNANKHIYVETVTANERPDLAQKYGIEQGNTGIIIECGEKNKILNSEELISYDYSTNETINVAEEKITSAIQTVTTDKIPQIYFLKGYSQFSLEQGMQFLNIYLKNEANEVKNVDLMANGKVPEDCDTLVITTPIRDFDEITTKAIIEYINEGKNILWFQGAIAQKNKMTNVNKILEIYGINPFEAGIIRETDKNRMLAELPDYILPIMQDTKVTKKIKDLGGAILINATKINTKEPEKLKEENIEKTDILYTSDKSYFRTDFTNIDDKPTKEEETKQYTIGTLMEKTITPKNEETKQEEKKSKLIIYGENLFVSDIPLSQQAQGPVIRYRQNKDLALNSIAYLTNKEENIVVRKNTGTVTYQATNKEDTIIKIIIFTLPIIIIITGIIVWIKRKRKK